MARKRKPTVGSAIVLFAFMCYAGIKNLDINPVYGAVSLILIVFLLIAMFALSFNKLAKNYISKETSVRVIDIKNSLPFLGVVCGFLLLFFLAFFFIHYIELTWAKYLAFALYGIIFFVGGYIATKHLAVLYFGVVVDKEHDFVAFAHDMESYTIMDYLTLQFVVDYCKVDIIPLSEIDRLSRGRGVELYMHGSFGSRGLLFSSKQKRDEALAIIKELNANNTKLLPDIEGY